MERSVVRFGGKRIEYQIQRSPRRRTVAVAVDPVEGVLLTAPTATSQERLDGIVRQKAMWILDRLRQAGQTNGTPSPREFVSGESCLYLGRHYRLKVVRGQDAPGARLERGWLTVGVPSGLSERHASGPGTATAHCVVRGARRPAASRTRRAVGSQAGRPDSTGPDQGPTAAVGEL